MPASTFITVVVKIVIIEFAIGIVKLLWVVQAYVFKLNQIGQQPHTSGLHLEDGYFSYQVFGICIS